MLDIAHHREGTENNRQNRRQVKTLGSQVGGETNSKDECRLNDAHMNGELGDKGTNETKDNAKKRAATSNQNELEYGAANVYAFFQARKLTVVKLNVLIIASLFLLQLCRLDSKMIRKLCTKQPQRHH